MFRSLLAFFLNPSHPGSCIVFKVAIWLSSGSTQVKLSVWTVCSDWWGLAGLAAVAWDVSTSSCSPNASLPASISVLWGGDRMAHVPALGVAQFRPWHWSWQHWWGDVKDRREPGWGMDTLPALCWAWTHSQQLGWNNSHSQSWGWQWGPKMSPDLQKCVCVSVQPYQQNTEHLLNLIPFTGVNASAKAWQNSPTSNQFWTRSQSEGLPIHY